MEKVRLKEVTLLKDKYLILESPHLVTPKSDFINILIFTSEFHPGSIINTG